MSLCSCSKCRQRWDDASPTVIEQRAEIDRLKAELAEANTAGLATMRAFLTSTSEQKAKHAEQQGEIDRLRAELRRR